MVPTESNNSFDDMNLIALLFNRNSIQLIEQNGMQMLTMYNILSKFN